jgi:hypothetical protein
VAKAVNRWVEAIHEEQPRARTFSEWAHKSTNASVKEIREQGRESSSSANGWINKMHQERTFTYSPRKVTSTVKVR